jgi:hypothetical protein
MLCSVAKASPELKNPRRKWLQNFFKCSKGASQSIHLTETLRHAASRAARTKATLADARCTLVAPRWPQTPLQGLKTPGAFFTNFLCCAGASLTMPCPSLGYPSVAKIFPSNRKSGCPMCSDSEAAGMSRAIVRNLSAVIRAPDDFLAERAPGRRVPGAATPRNHEPTLASSSFVAALTILNCSA